MICLHASHVYPGLRGVSELRYRSNDSTALWLSSLAHHPAVAFLYELSLENSTTRHSSRVTNTELHLPGLEESKSYVLDVWEQCDGQWESEHSRVFFQGANSSLSLLMRAAGPGQDQGQDQGQSVLSVSLVIFDNPLNISTLSNNNLFFNYLVGERNDFKVFFFCVGLNLILIYLIV